MSDGEYYTDVLLRSELTLRVYVTTPAPRPRLNGDIMNSLALELAMFLS